MVTMFRRRAERLAINRDAEQMIRDFSERAFVTAGELSWREDAGLLATRSAGHWHRVQEEIARREGAARVAAPSVRTSIDRPFKEQLAGLQ